MSVHGDLIHDHGSQGVDVTCVGTWPDAGMSLTVPVAQLPRAPQPQSHLCSEASMVSTNPVELDPSIQFSGLLVPSSGTQKCTLLSQMGYRMGCRMDS